MLLKRINYYYPFITLILYSLLLFKYSSTYLYMNVLNIFSIFTYSLLIILHIKVSNIKRKYLIFEVFFYTLFFIIFNNILSDLYTNNFFLFSIKDAVFYHESVLSIIDKPFKKAIDTYLSNPKLSFDDLGMILILYPLYHISESNLVLNLFYLFVSLVTALSIFSLSKNFMSHKYAYLAALSYALSSFVIFFHSSGLKESFMVMVVILSFDYYYKFLNKKNPLYLTIFLLAIGFLFLFRPAIPVMIIGSIGIGTLLSKKGGIGIKVVAYIFLIILIANISLLFEIVNRYMAGGFEMLMYARESQGMIIGSISFTYSVNILAQLIGPLPTLVSDDKIMLTFFASGLIYRVLLSLPFWLGILYIYKMKLSKLYPLAFFIIMEMLALALLMEGLELRKSLPHIAIVYIIAFWFLDKYDNNLIIIKKRKRFKYFFNFSIIILSIIILYWNFK